MEKTPLIDALVSLWFLIAPLVANLLLVLLLLLVGYVVAKALGAFITMVLKTLQLDKGSKRVGFSALLEKGEVRRSASELAGDAVYWLIIFLAVAGTAKIFGLAIEPALTKIFGFIGVALSSALVLGIGLFFASLISGTVKILAVNFGIEGGKTFSRVMYYVVVIFAFLAALSELGISTEVFVPQIGVIIGAFGLAAAIAFGLGCKDMAADFLHNLFKGK